MENKLKNAIAEKGNAVGTFLGISNAALIENISTSGLDYVVIDTEHGTYDLKDVSAMIRAADSKGLCPVVRVSDPTHREIQHALDEGAEGIIVPYLRKIEDFRKVAELGKFPPIGCRGFARGRGSCFGNDDWAAGSPEAYMAASNEKVLLIPQCETLEALENIEEIVKIEGIDGIFIGPYDLSICMGIPTQFDHPDFKSAVERIRKACRESGKLCMIYTTTIEEARMRLAEGFEAISHSLDAALYAQVYRETMAAIRPSASISSEKE